MVWRADEEDWKRDTVEHNRPWPKHIGTKREYTAEDVLTLARKELREMIGYEPVFLDRPKTKPNDKDVTMRWRKVAIPPPEEKGPIQGLKVCHDGWICDVKGCDAGGGYPYCNANKETFRKHFTSHRKAQPDFSGTWKDWSRQGSMQTFMFDTALLFYFPVQDTPDSSSSDETPMDFEEALARRYMELMGQSASVEIVGNANLTPPPIVELGIEKFINEFHRNEIKALAITKAPRVSTAPRSIQRLFFIARNLFFHICEKVQRASPGLRHLINRGSVSCVFSSC